MNSSDTSKSGLTIAGKSITANDSDYLEVVRFLTVPEKMQDDPAFKGSDIAALKALENPANRQIADGMIASTTPRVFETLGQAKAEFRFRRIAVNTMNRMNTGLNDADYFDPVHNVPPRIGSTHLESHAKEPHWAKGDFWTPIDLPKDRKDLANPKYWNAEFVANADADPAMVFWGNEVPYRGECAGAIQISVNIAARIVEGKEGYTERNPIEKLLVGVWSGSNTLDFYFDLNKDVTSPIYGDYMYLRNDPKYPTLAPNGFWMGLNCFYAGTDKLGVKRYSGLGVSWQSEEEIRTLMKNAFLGDTGRTAQPKEIKLTTHGTLTLHKTALGMGTPETRVPREGKTGPDGLTSKALEAAGFRNKSGDLFARADVSLGDLGKALDFAPHHLGQVFSAPAVNPPYRVLVDGTPVVVEYHASGESRHSPDAIVTAYAKAAK